MLKDIVSAIPLTAYTLQIAFEDGLEGTIDVAQLIHFDGIFAPLKEPEFFQQVTVSNDLGTLCWPNGADLDPDVLYAAIQSNSVPFSQSEQTGELAYSRNILPDLRQHFGDWIQPELTRAYILLKDDYIFLETHSQAKADETIERHNLFWVKFDTSPHCFSPLYTPEQNAQIFLAHLDDSYLMTYTVNIFTEEGFEAFSKHEGLTLFKTN